MASMRLLIVFVALIALLPVRPARAQSMPEDVRARAIEMVGVWTQAQRAPTPEARAQLTEKALQLALGFASWPLQKPGRDELLGQMWGQLANEYRRSQTGDRAQVTDRAIFAYTEAVKYYTPERAPQEWGKAQYGLGLAYVDRVRGDRADNVERSIEALQRAGQVFTRSAAPALWADIQVGLSRSYWHRVRGRRADNLEQAIAFASNALAVLSRDRDTADWVRAQSALGAAYWARVKGSRADNVETAIAAYEQALAVAPRERSPRVWAGLQDNLGMAYGERLRGSRGDNIEKAIAAFGRAGEVFTRSAAPFDWAQLQMNLGNAYSYREAGRFADNIEAAIAAYQGALTVYTPNAFPERWARVVLNLGTTYHERVTGDRADNVERAIEAHQNALRFYTRDKEPFKWAVAQNNLGLALRSRVRGERARNLELAAAAHDAALGVHTLAALPRDHMKAALFAGEVAAARGDWRGAMAHFQSAVAASTQLFGEGLDPTEAAAVVREGLQLFASAAYAAAELKEPDRALDLLEAGRARLLKVALGLDALSLSQADRSRLDALRADIREREGRLERAAADERASLLKEIAGLRASVAGVVTRAQAGAGDDPAHKSGNALAGSLLAHHAAIAAPVVTEHGARLLIAARSGAASPPLVRVVELPQLSRASLQRFLFGAEGSARLAGWVGAYSINQLPQQEAAARQGEWLGAIEGLAPTQWQMLGAKLAEALEGAGVARGASVLWLPQGALGLLPIALAGPAKGDALIDRYTIVTAPSLAAVEISRRRAAAAGQPSLAAIINPTGDLASTIPEGAAVASYFKAGARKTLGAREASADAVLGSLKGASYWHFATHGQFAPGAPRASSLLLAGDDRLTVGRLTDQAGLGNPRLAVLSACETGLYDFRRTPDEFIGLPSAFLQAGAAGVVGTLWPVDDVSTALLIIKFYDAHFTERVEPAVALRRAQLWLRDATREELQKFVAALRSGQRLGADEAASLASSLSQGASSEQPFRHPFYWAAFQFFGA